MLKLIEKKITADEIYMYFYYVHICMYDHNGYMLTAIYKYIFIA